jgi:hypothetical protein
MRHKKELPHQQVKKLSAKMTEDKLPTLTRIMKEREQYYQLAVYPNQKNPKKLIY